MKIKISDIEHARQVLAEFIDKSPLLYNRWLSNKYGCSIYLKLENMNPIGSFKIRGATYKISQLSEKERKRGVLATSAGNHAQGVAFAARAFKTKASIVMPKGAPLTKVQNTKNLGATVILEGDSVDESFLYAKTLLKKNGPTYVHPFEDPHVIAGQGTIALEILDDLPDVDMVFGAIGGGGLMAGVGTALKALKPNTEIIGGQASGARSLVESLKKRKLTQTHKADTFADGIKVNHASGTMFKILKDILDEVHHVDDEKIATAILNLMEKARTITEGAGALPLALLDDLYQKNPLRFKDKKIVLIICGGNIDVNLLGRIIDRGLTTSGRRLRMNIYLANKPGSLHLLTKIVSEEGGNILQVIHDHDSPKAELMETMIELTVETKGPEHSAKLVKELRKKFDKLELLGATL